MKQYWLMKCEATECTFDELYSRPDGIGRWRGVRNYEARNNIRAMKRGDGVLFYQSACADPGVSGIAEVRGAPYPDPTAIDPSSPYFDEKSMDSPRWFSVDIAPKTAFKRFVSLAQLKITPGLEAMRIVQRGQRLSVQPVTTAEFALVRKLGGRRQVRPE